MNDNILEKIALQMEPSIPVEHFSELGAALKLPDFVGNNAKRFLTVLSHALGVDLRIALPHGLFGYLPELWEGIALTALLKQKGLIESFTQMPHIYPDEPPLMRYLMQIKRTETERIPIGYGCHFFSRKKALWAAIGEAIERYAIFHFSPESHHIIQASYDELSKQKYALNIFSLAGFSLNQRAKGHPRFDLAIKSDSRFKWVEGYSLTKKRRAWIPLQMITLSYTALHKKEEPLLLTPISTGAAAHRTLDAAILNGLLEVIERDAFMITWVNNLSPDIIDLESIADEEIKTVLASVKRYHLEIYFLSLPSDIPVHIILAVTIDRTGGGAAVTVGASAHVDIKNAILGAAGEAISGRMWTRVSVDKKRKEGMPLELDISLLDQSGRLAWWYPHERIRDIMFLLNGKKKRIDQLPQYEYNEGDNTHIVLDRLVGILKKKNLEVFYCETMNEEMKKLLNFYAVMVIVPGLQPMHLDESLPYFSGERLHAVPEKLGISPAHTPNPIPHPFP